MIVIAIRLVFLKNQHSISVHLNMGERENDQLTLAKRTVRDRIAPDILGAIKTLNTKGNISRCYIARNRQAARRSIFRRFFGNLGFAIP
jgi:hypothetical protein